MQTAKNSLKCKKIICWTRSNNSGAHQHACDIPKSRILLKQLNHIQFLCACVCVFRIEFATSSMESSVFLGCFGTATSSRKANGCFPSLRIAENMPKCLKYADVPNTSNRFCYVSVFFLG